MVAVVQIYDFCRKGICSSCIVTKFVWALPFVCGCASSKSGLDVTDSTENHTPKRSTISKNSNFSVQFQIGDPPNRDTQIPWYKLKFNHNLNLNVYREIPRNLSFSIWWMLGM